MKANRKPYSLLQQVSSLLMIMALLWLTVSLPFVMESQQLLAKQDKMATAPTPIGGNEEEAANPFGNTTEEKKPCSNNSLSEEYLHHQDDHHSFFTSPLQHHNLVDAGTYVAYHGELLVPPPNMA
jgi:hypothetical protein